MSMTILPPLESRCGILPLLAMSLISCGAAISLIATLSIMVWHMAA